MIIYHERFIDTTTEGKRFVNTRQRRVEFSNRIGKITENHFEVNEDFEPDGTCSEDCRIGPVPIGRSVDDQLKVIRENERKERTKAVREKSDGQPDKPNPEDAPKK